MHNPSSLMYAIRICVTKHGNKSHKSHCIGGKRVEADCVCAYIEGERVEGLLRDILCKLPAIITRNSPQVWRSTHLGAVDVARAARASRLRSCNHFQYKIHHFQYKIHHFQYKIPHFLMQKHNLPGIARAFTSKRGIATGWFEPSPARCPAGRSVSVALRCSQAVVSAKASSFGQRAGPVHRVYTQIGRKSVGNQS